MKYEGPEEEDFVQTINHRKEPITFRYQRGNKIGKGGFGECYQARKYEGISANEVEGEVVIIKRQIKFQRCLQLQKGISNEQHRKEIRVNKILNSANMQYFPKYKSYWSDERYYYTVMQKIELGPLESLINNKIKGKDPMQDEQILYFIGQILKAICLMHKEKIMHCDLKGRNILVNREMGIKIIDFGLSEIGLGADPKSTKKSGTRVFMAPEIVNQPNQSGYSYSVDVWSIGILLHYMIFGKYLLQQEGAYEKLRNERDFNLLLEKWEDRGQQHPKSYKLMKKMLTYSASERPTVFQLINDEVLKNIDYQKIRSNLINKKFKSYIDKCLNTNYSWKKQLKKKQNLKLKPQYKVKILYLFRHEDYGYFYVLSNGHVRAYFNDEQDMLFKEGQKTQEDQKMVIISQIYQYVLEEKKVEFSDSNKIKAFKNKQQPNCQIVSLVETNGNLFVRLSNGTLQVFFNPQRKVKEDNFYSYELIVSINNNQNNIEQILFESDEGDFTFKNFNEISKQKPSNGPPVSYQKLQEKYYAYIIYIKKVMKIMLDNSQLHLKDYDFEINYGQKK